jgi:hypothetical protein
LVQAGQERKRRIKPLLREREREWSKEIEKVESKRKIDVDIVGGGGGGKRRGGWTVIQGEAGWQSLS